MLNKSSIQSVTQVSSQGIVTQISSPGIAEFS